MSIYLPIAELSVNPLLILFLGGVTGFLSGMFGIGGGFLMTPLLIFIGVPHAVAVSTSANQIIAASFSGFLAHWRKKNVDFQIGTIMLLGGLAGSAVGVWLFAWFQEMGQIDLVISLCYVLFLGSIGLMMFIESFRTLRRKRRGETIEESRRRFAFLHRLPFKMRFPRSKLYISPILPVLTGFFSGILVSLMGIGGGFVMIPAMIYILGMPTSVVIGTSLYQIIFITSNVTILQAINTQTVDILLALLMLTGAVVGAQIGTRYSSRLQAEQLRVLLALMVLAVAFRLGIELFIPPESLYSVEALAE